MKKAVYRLFIFVLIFTPLAFGTVERWSYTVMETISLSALCLLLFQIVRSRSTRIYEVPGLLPLSMFLAYIVFQAIPLPSFVIKVLSPGAHEVYSNTIWVNGSAQWGSISLNKKATLLEFFRVFSYAAFYVLTVQLLSKKKYFKKMVFLLTLYASLLALFAIIQHFSFNDRIYWVRELTQGGNPFGPYVNRNHYAGLMEMLFPIILSLFIFYKPQVGQGSLRERLVRIFDQRASNVHALLLLAATIVAISIFISLSRGAIISLSISMIFFGFMIIARMKEKKKGIVVVLIFIVILYAVGWFGWDAIFERFERIRNTQGDVSEMRLDLWKDSANIIKDFAITGAGLGNFVGIYPKYRTIPPGGIADHAHNDYIELMTDGGIIAIALIGWFMLSVILSSFKTFIKRRDSYSIYIWTGAVTGIVAILIHSITDFNLHIGANGLYFFFLLGFVVSAANTRFSDGSDSSYLGKVELPNIRLITYGTVAIMLVCTMYNVGVLLGNYHHSSIDRSRLDPGTSISEITKIRELSSRASAYDPLEGRYRFTHADSEWLLKNKGEALFSYKKAVRLDPLNGEYLQKLGLILSDQGDDVSADVLLSYGAVVNKQNPLRYQIYGSWLIKNGHVEDGIHNMRRAIELEPRKGKDYITLLVLHGLSDEEIQSALPDAVYPHLQFARYLERTGNNEMALEAYKRVLILDPDNGKAKRKLKTLQYKK